MKTFRELIGYLMAGLIFWLPIGVVVLAGSFLYGKLEDLGSTFLGLFIPDRFVFTGAGILFWIVLFVVSGLALKRLPARNPLTKAPFVGFLFSKEGNAMTLARLHGLTPCLFLYSTTCFSYGWILSKQGVSLDSMEAPNGLVNVYYPNVPTMVTGQVYAAPKDAVMRLGNSSGEIIDVLLYGLGAPEHLKFLPWEGESEADFTARARRFGLE